MRRLIVLLAVLPVSVFAKPKETIDLLFAVKVIDEVALAPDGGRLVYVEKQHNADRTESRNSFLQVLDDERASPRRVTAGQGAAHAEKHASWSRNGAQLAFLSDAEKTKQLQLYVVPAPGGTVRRLTSVAGQLARPRWSPDGKTIALLVIDGQTDAAGAVEAAARDAGEIAEKIFEQRILLVEVATGRARMITPADSYVYEFDWSPDGQQLAYVAAPGSGDNNWWIARLFAVETGSGRVREVFKPATQIAVPRWSPDGRSIAFIQGLMSDQGSTGGDIYSVPAERSTETGPASGAADSAGAGQAKNLTPNRPASPAWIAWEPSGKLIFSEGVRGRMSVGWLDPATGKSETRWTGAESMGAGGDASSISFSADGTKSAVIRSSWTQPPEVWSGALGAWRQRTQLNAALKPAWGRSESVEWTSDGRAVQGWLLYPRDFDPAQRYPMVVAIHGGPASQVKPAWPGAGLSFAALAAEGYLVFFPNPRGSYGQGAAFTAANVKDFGYGDLRDIMTGVDAVLKIAPVDPARLGVGGWSYGGFMTMWAVTQTTRFRAAVAGAGISNWQSYYGQNLIDQWMIPYFGASVYDDPAVYAKSSPINFIKAVKTPTLVVVGDSDKECPAPQSYEFWHALKTLGVETKFVVYEGEGHRFRKPAHIEDLIGRTIGWFDERLK
ncbi:MAG: S9 family peptidase [Opitutus sp.]|nr:S9 family peptidase [Opitutus sp.]